MKTLVQLQQPRPADALKALFTGPDALLIWALLGGFLIPVLGYSLLPLLGLSGFAKLFTVDRFVLMMGGLIFGLSFVDYWEEEGIKTSSCR